MSRSKAPKGPKVPKGPSRLRIPSPLSPELDQLVYDVIGAAMRVHSTLGPGLAERVYAEAYVLELAQRKIQFAREVPVEILYETHRVKRCRLDLIVANQIVVELKTVARLHPIHSSQMLTYLRATQLPVGIILNFNERHLRDGIRRHVLHPVPSR
jgi:GxxExxY protein